MNHDHPDIAVAAGVEGDLVAPLWTNPGYWETEMEGKDSGERSRSEDGTFWNWSGASTTDPSASVGASASTTLLPSRPPLAKRKPPRRPLTYKFRIYLTNGSYHVVSIGLPVTVADLTTALNSKLSLSSNEESYRLYLKERGHERMLTRTEKPAEIVRRRLEQAGYDVTDSLELLGTEDLSFLLKFIYKSQPFHSVLEEFMPNVVETVESNSGLLPRTEAGITLVPNLDAMGSAVDITVFPVVTTDDVGSSTIGPQSCYDHLPNTTVHRHGDYTNAAPSISTSTVATCTEHTAPQHRRAEHMPLVAVGGIEEEAGDLENALWNASESWAVEQDISVKNEVYQTSPSPINGMTYGIADRHGRDGRLDVLSVIRELDDKRKGEVVFAMFDSAQPPMQFPSSTRANVLVKYLRDEFLHVFLASLNNLNLQQNESVPDALRRSFLKLNQGLHTHLYSTTPGHGEMPQAGASNTTGLMRTGAVGTVLYFVGKTVYASNVGNAMAIVSKQGAAELVTRKHDPLDPSEIARICDVGGWVSQHGLVNDMVDISRAFGFYHLLPVVNARPDISSWELSELDEFLIVGNCSLWDYMSYQTAVDIARREISDPAIAAQKLRDFAISCGAEGGLMVVVIRVADLFNTGVTCLREPEVVSGVDIQGHESPDKGKGKAELPNFAISSLNPEIPPPTGHLTLVFTNICNSTHLWETNPAMPTAMRIHNTLLRRQLRLCGGYEVKTEGDTFMCSFPTTLSAVWWCLQVQIQLLQESWPLEILECEDGKEVRDAQGRIFARGLSVRMGIHCGAPICEHDPVTQRMDYFGPVVNRAARISSSAVGGQIVCSADVVREINAKVLETGPDTKYSDSQPLQAIDAISRIGVLVVPIGEVKIKGLEVPEELSIVYPIDLEGRHNRIEAPADVNASSSKIQYSKAEMLELGMICLRLEALASSRASREFLERGQHIAEAALDDQQSSMSPNGDSGLLHQTNETASDADIRPLLNSLSTRIENALAAIRR